MTEEEWRTCDDVPRMLRFIAQKWPALSKQYNPRKIRLYACACCRAVWDESWPRRCRDVVEVAERFADGLATEQELNNARSLACQAAQNQISRGDRSQTEPPVLGSRLTFAGDTAIADRLIAFRLTIDCERETFQADMAWKTVARPLLLDIFGTVFWPAIFLPEWRTDTVLALSRQMYESRDFGAMPILADALQDAGCDDEEILTHCRGDVPHVRGCWVVDACLGRS